MRSARIVVSISIFLALSLGVDSHLLAIHYQEQGAYLLTYVLLAKEHSEDRTLWLGSASLPQPENAITALSSAVRLRNINPSAWWSLGLAYEQLASASQISVHRPTDTLPLAPSIKPVIIDRTETNPALIPAMETTSTGRGPSFFTDDHTLLITRYAQWFLPDAPGAWPDWWVPSDPVSRTVLLFSAPGEVSFRVSIPTTPTALLFWAGVDPYLSGSVGDSSVVYRVLVEGREALIYALRMEEARWWWPAWVDMTPWAGQTVRLTLALDYGLVGNTTGYRAGWGDVQLVLAKDSRCVLANCLGRAVSAWEEGGFTTQDFILAGEIARKAERHDESLRWYERAMRMEPSLGDPWYYEGQAYEGMEKWAEALEAYKWAVARQLAEVHRSSPYYRMGVIYQWKLESKETERALEAIGKAIALGDFRSDWEAADAHYRRGLILRQQRMPPEEYIVEFEKAVGIYPQHGMAHVLLGRAYYESYGDVEMAEEEIEAALKLNPQNKWAYLHLGDVYRQAGMCEEARRAYRDALVVDPLFNLAVTRLGMQCGLE